MCVYIILFKYNPPPRVHFMPQVCIYNARMHHAVKSYSLIYTGWGVYTALTFIVCVVITALDYLVDIPQLRSWAITSTIGVVYENNKLSYIIAHSQTIK